MPPSMTSTVSGSVFFEGGVLALKLGDQRGELRQVSAQRNGEHANAGFGFRLTWWDLLYMDLLYW